MSENNPTIEELERKLVGVKNTKGRMDILAHLARGYRQDIYSTFEPKISNAESKCSYANPSLKKDTERFVDGIKKLAEDKYKLQHETVCKIADGNTLTFVLYFNYDSIPTVVSAKKDVQSLKRAKEAAEKKLSRWNRDMLMRIANGDDFTGFTAEAA